MVTKPRKAIYCSSEVEWQYDASGSNFTIKNKESHVCYLSKANRPGENWLRRRQNIKHTPELATFMQAIFSSKQRSSNRETSLSIRAVCLLYKFQRARQQSSSESSKRRPSNREISLSGGLFILLIPAQLDSEPRVGSEKKSFPSIRIKNQIVKSSSREVLLFRIR